ncbi:Uncharacterised protein [Mycobacteroides abscessus subsp. abscessus]|nr:Uncharacterised protein [Mycobacteroides abscessus subsp. abscessus]
MGESAEMADSTQRPGMHNPDSKQLTSAVLHPASSDCWPASVAPVYDYPEPRHRQRKRVFTWRVAAAATAATGIYSATLAGAYIAGTNNPPEHHWAASDDGAGGPPLPTERDARERACGTLAASYPTLSPRLRANHSPPTQFVAPEDFPNRTLHGEATDLAEILNADLGPAFSARPWPVWLQAFDNYVAALRAISFVETNPTPPPVKEGIDNLYQHSIVEPLRICHIADR